MSKTIPYVDRTWNPMVGCSHEQSPGCAHCYAARLASTRLAHLPAYQGLATKGRWTGRVNLRPDKLDEPLHWRKPQRIFVCDMGDLFHEQVSNEFIAAAFGIMAGAPQHTFLVLTKRAERMRKWFEWAGEKIGPRTWRKWANEACNWGTENDVPIRWARIAPADWPWPIPNVWLGVTVCNQSEADERIPHLLATPAAHRWVSAEPLLKTIDFDDCVPGLDWIVVGGESGYKARPCALEWLDDARRQCEGASTSCFIKQLGSHAYAEFPEDWGVPRARMLPTDAGRIGAMGIATRHRSGADPDEWPERLRVRQIPGPEAML